MISSSENPINPEYYPNSEFSGFIGLISNDSEEKRNARVPLIHVCVRHWLRGDHEHPSLFVSAASSNIGSGVSVDTLCLFQVTLCVFGVHWSVGYVG